MAKIKIGQRSVKKSRLRDWHLWNEVKLTVSPLAKKTHSDGALTGQDRVRPSNSSAGEMPVSVTPFVPRAPKSIFPYHQIVQEQQLPTIEPKMRRRVRRGKIPIDATIDLHGMTQNVARITLHQFIKNHAKMGNRTLLVITGKGMKNIGSVDPLQRGVLRHMLPRWLKEPDLSPLIAGFEVSARHHGGEGAFYVRLKKGRP